MRNGDGNRIKAICYNQIMVNSKYRPLARIHIGAYDTWLEAALSYRNFFEKASGAKRLWKQSPIWVRKIHAVHTGLARVPQADKYFGLIEKKIAPEKLLLFYLNGNGIVLFGDNRYTTKLGRPDSATVDGRKKFGFHWM